MSNNGNSISLEDIQKIAASPAGQKLIQTLQQTKSTELQQAAEKAAAGDFLSAKQALATLLQDPQVKNFLDQLGR